MMFLGFSEINPKRIPTYSNKEAIRTNHRFLTNQGARGRIHWSPSESKIDTQRYAGLDRQEERCVFNEHSRSIYRQTNT